MTFLPDFSHEADALRQGALRVAGVDEVGRGPLAGPVTAAAVVLEPGAIPEGLNDSKKLSAARREALAAQIVDSADWAVAHIWPEEIDRLNIYHAAHLAMCRALAGLRAAADFALVDGNRLPRDLPCAGLAVVKGDGRSLSIAAASIIAKVARDRIMVDLAQQFPAYAWDRNAGYPTKQHLDALESHGVTPYHRRSFRPVHNILCRDISTSD
ncbi:MAG: ribonuclease HII [Paracoccus sp. (in: a-proteobacteria)]|nr:ribonuclease HII [Paracoccus sp. (in: a-proteobacteria)]